MPKARPDGNSVISTIPEDEAEVAGIESGDRLAAVAVADAVLFTKNLSGEEREVYLKHLLAAQQELADDE